MIVPFAAGGPTDIIARIVAEYFAKALGQQFVVENVAGAGGTTGITRAAQATPDGYTIMMGHMGTHGAAPGALSQPQIRPGQGLRADRPGRRHADPHRRAQGLPGQRSKEFIAHAKDTSDKNRQAHAGVGSVSHSTCTLLTSMIGVKHTRGRLSRHRARRSTTSSAVRSTSSATRSSTSSRRSRAAPSRPMPSRRRSARRRCRTCRPPRRRACPSTR